MSKELIERLEKAEAGDHKLNAEICWLLERDRALSGWWRGAMGKPVSLPEDFDSLPNGLGMASLEVCAPKYTTSIDAALALAERVLPDHDWSVGCLPVSDDADYEEHHSFGALLYSRYTKPYDAMAHGATPALALVTAILKAQGAQQ